MPKKVKGSSRKIYKTISFTKEDLAWVEKDSFPPSAVIAALIRKARESGVSFDAHPIYTPEGSNRVPLPDTSIPPLEPILASEGATPAPRPIGF